MKNLVLISVIVTSGVFVSVICRSIDQIDTIGTDDLPANFTALRQLIYDVLEKQRLELVAKEDELRPIRERNDWLKANLTEQLAERHRLENEMVNIHPDEFTAFFRNVSQLSANWLDNEVDLEPPTDLQV